jgi:hypothetical protein
LKQATDASRKSLHDTLQRRSCEDLRQKTALGGQY